MKIYKTSDYADMLLEKGLLLSKTIRNTQAEVLDITYDSKATLKGSLFVCKGKAFKSQYLAEAIMRGAACYISEREYDIAVDCIIVKDVRKAMAYIAEMASDHAYSKLNLIGITGTKGKSTTAYYVKYIIDEYCQANMKKPSGIVSSIDVYDGKSIEEARLTTPEALVLHKHFDNAVDSGIEYFTMEVSSQALKYERVLGVTFDIGVFLNISLDHISENEHSDFDDYLSAKLKLFSQSKLSIINKDADHWDTIAKAAEGKNVLTLSQKAEADYQSYNVRKTEDGIFFFVKCKDFDEEFCLTMPGLFNVENALAAIAVCHNLGIPIDDIRVGLSKARSSGRMEIFYSEDKKKIAIVDYAHNKLSFTALYESIEQEYPGYEIITVFGCPGGKAINRRQELGELAGMHSKKVYLTAEDPGYEEVSAISEDIAQYVRKYDCECYAIDERGDAIETAIEDADDNSIILITGKGNETRQKVKNDYLPCLSDTEIVKKVLWKSFSKLN